MLIHVRITATPSYTSTNKNFI